MTARLTLGLALFTASTIFLAGCGDKAPPSAVDNKDKKGHDHTDHDSGTSKKEDAKLPDGKKCHACLTAHMSKTETELDVFFETFDKEPKPVTLPEKTKLTATVTRMGDDMKYTLAFEPAEQDERKTDPAGQCSRFKADVKAWMKPEDKLTLTLTIEGQAEKIVWVDFNPKKFSHKHD